MCGHRRPPLTGRTKLNVEMERQEPLNFLKLLIDDALINYLVLFNYASAKLNGPLKQH